MKYRTILLFGAPGSGKGTQGKIIGTIPTFFHFACGDAFRNLRIDEPIGQTFIQYSSKGRLVPDESTIALWSKIFRPPPSTAPSIRNATRSCSTASRAIRARSRCCATRST